LVLAIGAGALASLAYSQIFPTFHTLRGLRTVIERPVLGAVTLQSLAPVKRRRRLSAMAFACGLAGLFAMYGSVFAWLLLGVRQ
jgi:hypothetical protein